jgi:tripartite-type tricarboxylate transporter receptor subunit TctC
MPMCRLATLVVTLAAVTLAIPTASAQDNYPSRRITLIAPFAAGGSVDLVSRILSEGLSARLGQPVIVDNRPGGNGLIGIREALRAKPDGYTLLLGSVGANVTPALIQPNFPFDPLRDYVPLAMVAEWTAILVVKQELPPRTLQEFIAYAKARPGKINFGATGYGGLAHLVGEVFMQQTGIRGQYIQYKGGSQGTVDLLGGTIDAQMMSSPVAAGQVDSTRLKILAVANKHRLKILPNVPTMAEGGVAGVNQTAWQGVFSAPGVPQQIRERIAREVFAITSDPAYQQKLLQSGFEPLPLDGDATERMYREELKQWTVLIKERGLAGK